MGLRQCRRSARCWLPWLACLALRPAAALRSFPPGTSESDKSKAGAAGPDVSAAAAPGDVLHQTPAGPLGPRKYTFIQATDTEVTPRANNSSIILKSGGAAGAGSAKRARANRGVDIPSESRQMLELAAALGILVCAVFCLACTIFRRRGPYTDFRDSEDGERMGHRPTGREPPPPRETIAADTIIRTSSLRFSTSSRPRDRMKGSRTGQSSVGTEEEQPKVVLCPLLLIPPETRLDCLVDRKLCRRRQDMVFNVRGISGAELFQVRVAESSATARIHLETLGGRDHLAAVSTEEIWKAANPSPKLELLHQGGAQFGFVQKSGADYVVQDRASVLFRFVGDFARHQYEAKNMQDDTVASVNLISDTQYKVIVHSQTDAGLMVLSALAIDKCEILPGHAH